MPEQPIPEQDPVVTKSYALYYVVAMVLLMATLFWALWDEAYGQRPWKAFQQRMEAALHRFPRKTEPASDKSVKAVEKNPDYQQLEEAYKQADVAARPRRDELQKQITDLSAKILAVQNVFTDKRAYVNALTYQIETETSASGKESKQKEMEEYKKRLCVGRVSRRPQREIQLPSTGREIQRTERRAHQAERRHSATC